MTTTFHVKTGVCILLLLIGCAHVVMGQDDTMTKEQMEALFSSQIPLAFTRFLEAMADNDYQEAYNCLHRQLQQPWSIEVFLSHMRIIRETLGDAWAPIVTGTFEGQSGAGPYKQASYQLEEQWNSVWAINFTSVNDGNEQKIIQLMLKAPYDKTISSTDRLQSTVLTFVDAIREEDYEAAKALLAPSVQSQVNVTVFQQLRDLLVKDQWKTVVFEQAYRTLINGMWYDTVFMSPQEDPASHFEIIMSLSEASVNIASFNFKGRVGR